MKAMPIGLEITCVTVRDKVSLSKLDEITMKLEDSSCITLDDSL